MTGHAGRTDGRRWDGRIAVALLAVLAWPCIGAIPEAKSPGSEPEREPSRVVVTATRTPEPAVELPVAIDAVSRQAISEGQLEVNLSEALMTVPGLSIQSRRAFNFY